MSVARSERRRVRRREIERRLIAGGLLRGPRRLRAAGAPELAAPTGELFLRRLDGVLADLGPVFAAFPAYLSRRPDLLPVDDCMTLAALAEEPRRSLPAAVVVERLGSLGRSPAELFADFATEPCAAGALEQVHRARLADGEEVLVRLAVVDSEEGSRQDLALLSVLEAVFDHHPTLDFERAVTDFRQWFRSRIDLTVQAGHLETLSRHAADSDLLLVPRVHRRLSGPGVLTVSRPEGVDLAAQSADDGAARGYDLARRLHLLWLEQALVTGLFPVTADVVVTPEGGLGVVGGELEEMPEPARTNLWKYLQATVTHHPDRAGECLLRELEPVRRNASEADLELRLRQVVPFRDGCWSEHGNNVAEYVVLHWQVAQACGFRPRRHLAAFFQGLFWAARQGHRLAPHADPLRGAQEDMRWLAGWNQFRQLTDPRQLGESLEANLASLLELPQKLDQVLSLASAEELPFRVEVREPANLSRRKNSLTLAVCLGLALATLLLLFTQIGELGLDERWIERLSAALFLVIGGALLWLVARR